MLVGVEIENLLYHPGLALIDGQHTVLFVIPPQLVVAQYMAVFDGLFSRSESLRTSSLATPAIASAIIRRKLSRFLVLVPEMSLST